MRLPRSGLFVSVDGVDGVGKTTACIALAAALGAMVHKSPCGPFADARARVDAEADPVTRCLFYRAAAQHDVAVIRAHLALGTTVVCDRSIYSTFAYHVALQPSLEACFPWIGIQLPDVAFLLTASREARCRRLAARKRADGVLSFREEDQAYQDRVDAIFRRLPMTVVDTTRTPAPAVTARMVSRLRTEAA